MLVINTFLGEVGSYGIKFNCLRNHFRTRLLLLIVGMDKHLTSGHIINLMQRLRA